MLLTLFAAVLAAAGPAYAQDSAINQALSSVDPSLAYDPNAARVGDFNGDGLEDVAAIVAGPEKRALVVFHPTPNGGYVAYPLYATLPPGDVDLRLVPPGRHRVLSPQGVVEHATPALELIFPGRSSALYVWRNGRYQVFATENY